MGDDHLVQAVHAQIRQHGGPGEGATQLRQVLAGRRVVDFFRVAVVDGGPLVLGHRGLQGDNGLRFLPGLLNARQLEQSPDIAGIGLQHRLIARIVGFQVVVAVGQAQAGLAQIGGIAVRLFQVLVDIQ